MRVSSHPNSEPRGSRREERTPLLGLIVLSPCSSPLRSLNCLLSRSRSFFSARRCENGSSGSRFRACIESSSQSSVTIWHVLGRLSAALTGTHQHRHPISNYFHAVQSGSCGSFRRNTSRTCPGIKPRDGAKYSRHQASNPMHDGQKQRKNKNSPIELFLRNSSFEQTRCVTDSSMALVNLPSLSSTHRAMLMSVHWPPRSPATAMVRPRKMGFSLRERIGNVRRARKEVRGRGRGRGEAGRGRSSV